MSQFTLKLIALAAMLLDHTAKILLSTGILVPVLGMELNFQIQTAMTVIGRMAFPIFAWFAAEGCRRTSNPEKHLARLLLFAILSEAPFQLCFYGELSWGCHNVIFTLLLAAAAIYLGRRLTRWIPAALANALTGAAAIALGWILHTDYNAWGVLLVLMLYNMPTEKGKLLALTSWITVFQLIWHGWNGQSLVWLSGSGSLQVLHWIGAMTSVPFLAAYHGGKGRNGKWLFYLFYPCHLLLLYAVSAAL